jgi:2-polyprenyl-3-methyl-5-hydroxy-6-metoxy-1,4-benzoquinol methylase
MMSGNSSDNALMGDTGIVEGEWAAADLEWLGACPVCGSDARDALLTNLPDTLFYNAPGRWDYYQCQNCRSGYIDPRPTADSIGRAYDRYYTHEESKSLPPEELHGLKLVQRALANGYKNAKFKTNLQPSSKLGHVLALALPWHRAVLDRQYRHIDAGQTPGRVLDIGSGDGGFLENAKSIGWTVVGVDVDPAAVANARSRGLDVRQGTVHDVEGPFDLITMSHVIEHLHDPIEVLRACYRLLSPGGSLWLETPNSRSVGLKRLGRGWLGLDAPRHLLLFNRESLKQTLLKVGFGDIKDLPQASPVIGLYKMSPRLLEGRNPFAKGRVPLHLRAESVLVTVYEKFFPSRREFIALTARKAG